MRTLANASIIEKDLNQKGIYTAKNTIPFDTPCLIMEKGHLLVFISLEKNKDLSYKKHLNSYKRQGYNIYSMCMTREEFVHKQRGHK